MEEKRRELTASLNAATARAYAHGGRRTMSERWARTILSAYRWAGAAAYPFIGTYVAWRAAKGKEDSSRRRERYGIAGKRAPGRAAGLDACRKRRRDQCGVPLIERILDSDINVVLTTGTVTSAKVAEARLGRPHHPPIRAARPQAGGQQLPRPLDAGPRHHRRIRDLADDHPRARRAPRAAGAGQRPPVRPLLCLVEEARLHRRGAVREPRACGGADRAWTASASPRSARGR